MILILREKKGKKEEKKRGGEMRKKQCNSKLYWNFIVYIRIITHKEVLICYVLEFFAFLYFKKFLHFVIKALIIYLRLHKTLGNKITNIIHFFLILLCVFFNIFTESTNYFCWKERQEFYSHKKDMGISCVW